MDELGDGRYRLGDQLDERRYGGLFQAVDRRLGRAVLVQADRGTRFPTTPRLVGREPWQAPLLDGGDDVGPDGEAWAYTVYPDSSWLPFGWLTRPQRRRIRMTVALDTDDLLVDPAWLVGKPAADAGPVSWLPSPSELIRCTTRPGRAAPAGTIPAPFREEVA